MFLHVLGDALGNVGVMVSALIIWLSDWKGRYYADPAISLLITLIILRSAIPLVLQTSKPLLQATPNDLNISDIKSDIEGLRGVADCHHVHVWALTPSRMVATLDVKLDFGFEGNKGASRWMDLANEIKECLHEHGIHHSTIQPEFADKVKEGMCAMVCAESCDSGTTTPKAGRNGTCANGDAEPLTANPPR